MEGFDWKIVILGFNVFTYISGAIAFCIIKFNDFKHLEDDVKDLEAKQDTYELKQNKRHEENIRELAKLAKEVSYLCGRQEK
jgi:hypothetical protein